MYKILFASVVAASVLVPARGAIVSFNYTQSDSTTGSGTIAPFTFMGHDFTATAMPAATVFNPNPGLTPAGFIGAQNTAIGNANEANTAVGLLWGGTVRAFSTDGYSIDISLRFVPKQTQTPDINDYTWNVSYGDSPANGVDAVSTAAARFAMWLSRDDVIDGVETADRFQRYTQLTHSFGAGTTESFSNTDTATTAIKDATDPPGAPAGVDAAGRDLAFYWGWRDQGPITSGAVLVDNFTISGLLEAQDATLMPVPEPSSVALGILGLAALFFWRRRR